MNWSADGPCAYTREDGRYTINRAPQRGYPVVLTLVDRRSHTIVRTARLQEASELDDAWNALVSLCEPRDA